MPQSVMRICPKNRKLILSTLLKNDFAMSREIIFFALKIAYLQSTLSHFYMP